MQDAEKRMAGGVQSAAFESLQVRALAHAEHCFCKTVLLLRLYGLDISVWRYKASVANSWALMDPENARSLDA